MTASGRAAGPRLAKRLIRALLLLYPREFREEFGGSVQDLIERDLDTASTRGSFTLARALGSHAWDIVFSALGQRFADASGQRGVMRSGGDGVIAAWSAWRRDAMYGGRLLAKHRAFSIVVIVTLALAIGANTVIFTFANVLLLRPLPWRNPATLGWVFNIAPHADDAKARVSLADFYDFRASSRSFSALGARRAGTLTLSGRSDAERLNVTEVTANLLEIWGLEPVAGRLFQKGDDAPGAAPVVVLSHQFWQRRLGGDRAIVGQTLVLDGIPRIVIGILDPAIEIGSYRAVDVWTPLVQATDAGRRDDRRLSITGQLAPGVSHAQATAEIHAIAARLQREHPQTNSGWDAHVLPMRQAVVNGNGWLVFSLLGVVVTLVLLIACANLANLMLARSADRAREVALRTALGASRRAIVRQLIVESLLLGAIGGAVGLLLAAGGLVVVKAVAYDEFFRLLAIDRNVVLFVGGITILTTLAFSLAPALQISRTDVTELLKAGSGKASGGRGIRRGRTVLVVSQVALALSLAIAAVLVVRTVIASARIDPGFDPHDAFMFRVDVPSTRFTESGRLALLYEKMITELGSIPGVANVGLTSRFPVLGGDASEAVTVDGARPSRPADQPYAANAAVSAEFFEAARIPVIVGRVFSQDDNAATARVAIVNREMATRYWGSPAAALGKRVARSDAPSTEMTIVGVVAGTRPSDVTLPPVPQLYVPMAQASERSVSFLLRSARAAALLPDVRAAMRRVDNGLAIYDAGTVDEAFRQGRSSDSLLTGMFIAFAAIALTLAAAGLYGVVSYSVSQRTREIGIRVALGATARDVRTLVLAHGARLFLTGAAIGIAGGATIANAMRTLLYGVSPLDPATYVLVIAVVVMIMGLATYIPARRAVRADPNVALRSE